jgi:hypothetical protein
MVPIMMVTGIIIKLREMENIIGQMDESMLENGSIINFMAKESTHGKMVVTMMENIGMI